MVWRQTEFACRPILRRGRHYTGPSGGEALSSRPRVKCIGGRTEDLDNDKVKESDESAKRKKKDTSQVNGGKKRGYGGRPKGSALRPLQTAP